MKKKLLIAAAICILLFIIAAIVVYLFVVKQAFVPTGAMANTIIPGDLVAGYRLFGEVRRGDIVTFRLPQDPKVIYVKRIIGLPGEEILVRSTEVLINGKPLPEQKVMVRLSSCAECALLPEISTEPAPTGADWKVYYDGERDGDDHLAPGMKYGVDAPFRIPAGHYFVMGDSRDNSLDSRFWGTVPAENVISSVTMVVVSYEMEGNRRTGKMRDNRAFLKIR